MNGTGQLKCRETKVERRRRGFGFLVTLPFKAVVYVACGSLTCSYIHIAQELRMLFLPPYVPPTVSAQNKRTTNAIHVYICLYVCVCVHIYIYIYIYRERERGIEREREGERYARECSGPEGAEPPRSAAASGGQRAS